MTRNPKVRRAVRLALLMGGTAALLANSAAFAQEQDQDADEKPMEEVVVTGSRIISTNLDSPSPVQTISSEDIAKTGVVNLQDILLKNPTFGTPLLSRTNSNFLTSGAGVSTVDLRNLGANRTLILVNGKRLGIIRTPEVPANLAFGGPDLRTLFFTARTSVYTLRVRTPGQPHPWYRARR